jgi:hypothetical protein
VKWNYSADDASTINRAGQGIWRPIGLWLARPEGLEPPAYWFEANRSIQLSYGRVAIPIITAATTFAAFFA